MAKKAALPPAAVPETIATAGAKGAAAAIIITAGFGHGPGSLAEAAEWTARTTGLRPVGPNCLAVPDGGENFHGDIT